MPRVERGQGDAVGPAGQREHRPPARHRARLRVRRALGIVALAQAEASRPLRSLTNQGPAAPADHRRVDALERGGRQRHVARERRTGRAPRSGAGGTRSRRSAAKGGRSRRAGTRLSPRPEGSDGQRQPAHGVHPDQRGTAARGGPRGSRSPRCRARPRSGRPPAPPPGRAWTRSRRTRPAPGRRHRWRATRRTSRTIPRPPRPGSPDTVAVLQAASEQCATASWMDASARRT